MRSLFLAFAILFALPAMSATLWVTEFTGAPPNSVYYQAVKAPALANQTVTVGGVSTQSAVIKLIRMEPAIATL